MGVEGPEPCSTIGSGWLLQDTKMQGESMRGREIGKKEIDVIHASEGHAHL